jgi:hypothetical protein
MGALKMTPEIRSKLAGLLPMSDDSVYEFTPEIFDDIPDEFKPVFSIKQFDNSQVSAIKTMMLKENNDSSTVKKVATILKEADKKAVMYSKLTFDILVDWDNLYDLGNGEKIEFNGDYDVFMTIPESIRTDIFTTAMKITGFLPHGLV